MDGTEDVKCGLVELVVEALGVSSVIKKDDVGVVDSCDSCDVGVVDSCDVISPKSSSKCISK